MNNKQIATYHYLYRKKSYDDERTHAPPSGDQRRVECAVPAVLDRAFKGEL